MKIWEDSYGYIVWAVFRFGNRADVIADGTYTMRPFWMHIGAHDACHRNLKCWTGGKPSTWFPPERLVEWTSFFLHFPSLLFLLFFAPFLSSPPFLLLPSSSVFFLLLCLPSSSLLFFFVITSAFLLRTTSSSSSRSSSFVCKTSTWKSIFRF